VQKTEAGGPPMLRRIYDWCIAAADKPYALWILSAVAFAESSFFPVPPDIMLLPMSLAKPQRAWLYAGVCTIASVAGGLLGYAIGALLYDSVGHWLINLYGYGDKVETFRESYAKWGALIILIKGVTPIPYKLVTITSGFAGYNIWLFTLFSVITRGARFFLAAVVLNRYGDPIRRQIEKNLGLWVTLFAVVLIAGFVIAVKLL
jgi:membrane protein YqaA with SNARE-associated domain